MINAIKSTAKFMLVIWAVYIIDVIMPFLHLTSFGILPRTTRGLIGIPASVFLHGGWEHIVSNSLALIVVMPLLLLIYPKVKYHAMAGIIIIGGGLVWLFAPSYTVHIGASGLIFGIISFIILAGIYKRNFKSILISLVILFMYGGSLWQGIIPQEGISWQGHLFGILAGFLMALALKSKMRERPNLV